MNNKIDDGLQVTPDWQKMGHLLPCVVQNAHNGMVLMLGYMNQEALNVTRRKGFVTFYSRSRDCLWTKGETSGNKLQVVSLELDCDRDAILVRADPKGPTCHKGVDSCFSGDYKSALGFLGDLDTLLTQRYLDRPPGSYTTSLFDAGIHRMAQKVGEEGVEVALAAKDDDADAFLGESADLLFHLMVLAKGKGHSLQDILQVLQDRHS